MTDSDPQQLICLDRTLLPIMSQKNGVQKESVYLPCFGQSNCNYFGKPSLECKNSQSHN